MKTAVGLMTIITAMVATDASAEWRLYVNRDNKAWSLERAYVSNDDCDRAARTLYGSGQALGVGCAEYPPPSAAQGPAPRPAEYSRSMTTASRPAARADEPTRMNASRSSAPRVAEYPVRSTASRQVAAVERAPDPVAASASHPAAVIFPPSGGIEIRSDEAPVPAVVASRPVAAPRRQAAPAAPQRSTEDPAAVALAKVVSEASAASAREVAAEATKREEAVAADLAERRTQLAIFGGIALVVATGVAYSVYRVARTSPLRGLAVCLIEIGVLMSALAYPVVELWNRLKISTFVVSSWLPGVFVAGIVIAGGGVVVLALELRRKPARATAAGSPTRDAEHKPQAPVELIKPGEHVKTGEPGKPVEPVRPLQPIRPLEPVRALDAPAPGEPVKSPAPPAPMGGGSLADRLVR